jgi:hypothetical protein
MGQSLTQTLPDEQKGLPSAGAAEGVLSPAKTRRITSQDSGAITMGTRSPSSYGGHTMIDTAWRRGAPQPSFRQRVASWRARNWRRAVLAWFVTVLAVMAVAAEPVNDFPRAQANAVPAVRVTLSAVELLTVAGVPLLLVALP